MPANTIYKIYYGNTVVYVGRTRQPLQDRIRGHVFGRPMHRKIDILQVSKIEHTELPTVADMFLYEVYYINKYKPALNRDDKAQDDLTVELPELEWSEFTTYLWDKWKAQVEADISAEAQLRKRREEEQKLLLELRRKHAAGQISEEDYWRQRNELDGF